MAWTTADISDQSGRTAIVTGANSGIGLEATRELLAAGADVVLACRSMAKAQEALDSIPGGGGQATVMELNLSSLDSVRSFAESFNAAHNRLDLLINNAGVMFPPPTLTDAGVELQWGTNHLGHFALTGLLFEKLLSTPESRVVNVSSLAAGSGDLKNLDPTSLSNYNRSQSYSDSKLANQVFTVEMNRRLVAKGIGPAPIAVAAHPGVSSTNLISGFGMPAIVTKGIGLINKVVLQGADAGALPTLRAATDPEVQPNDYFGPDGRRQIRGAPVPVRLQQQATDAAIGRWLWEHSIEHSGVEYLTDL